MFLITTSLLNSWAYLFKVDEQYYDKSFNEFLSSLKRQPFEPNKYMLAGIEFEDRCVAGEIAGISDKIAEGAYQYKAKKWIEVDGVKYLLYGKLDALKAGEIFDIKLNVRYEVGKYFDSYQHHMYMEMVEQAKRFTYLIGVKNGMSKEHETGDEFTIHEEVYTRDECRPMDEPIRQFIKWLKENNLLEVYQEHWKTYE